MKTRDDFLKSVCALAVPVALQSMLQSSFSMVDQIMIGQLGEINVAGVGLAGKFASIYSVVISAIGAVGCACFFFSDAEKWRALLAFIQTRDIVVLLCYVLLCAAWILLPKFDIPPRNNEKENQ